MPDARDLATLVAEITSAYVTSHKIEPAALAVLIRDIRISLTDTLGNADKPPTDEDTAKPAVKISESIGDEFLVCLEDGKRLKSMKRYLRTRFGLTPQQYREKWSLPPDYPMVAPKYGRRRSNLAMMQGFGRTKNADGMPVLSLSKPDVAVTTLRSIGDGVVCTDIVGLVAFMNPVAERLTGWNASQAFGKPVAEVLSLREACSGIAVRPAQQCIELGKAYTVEVGTVLVNRVGEKHDVGFSAAPIKTIDGDVIGSVLILNDLTTRDAGG